MPITRTGDVGPTRHITIRGDSSEPHSMPTKAILEHIVAVASRSAGYLRGASPDDVAYARKQLGSIHDPKRFLSSIYFAKRHGVEMDETLLAHVAVDMLEAGNRHAHPLRKGYRKARGNEMRYRSLRTGDATAKKFNLSNIHADTDYQAVARRHGIRELDPLRERYVNCCVGWISRGIPRNYLAAAALAPFPTRRATAEAESLLRKPGHALLAKMIRDAIATHGLSRQAALAKYGAEDNDEVLRLLEKRHLPADAYEQCIAGTPCNDIVLNDENEDVRLTLQRIAIGRYLRSAAPLPRYSDVDAVAAHLGIDAPELRQHFRKAVIWEAFDRIRLGTRVGDVARELGIPEGRLALHAKSWQSELPENHTAEKRWGQVDCYSFRHAFTVAAKTLMTELVSRSVVN
ncbi:hypothetical protein K6W16_21330 [Burkholderia dolosa]|uniref:Uncharacterized protein n=1 Tax=Burkholderia dolosa TaxID=152500 RepID=A0A892IBA7_9BURK|nr:MULTISPECIES: hypothetical protein [Burkholderia]AJY14600.1 hypothetical protein AK34_2887 [Burkholderia dolosa AU0158]MBR8420369.1 hypothetical protein [Burkholderia dolosa]MBY4659893.1 hypothetical protein [Burkholderia dolosa]MBY4691659.1 hypothetical protein [Burkholderia dolosa]MBY4784489.1 hypothetical protein [Burkholderia dolosa]